MFERVKKLIEDNMDCQGNEITLKTRLLDDLNINSLDLVELVCAFEVAFNVNVPEADLRKFVTVSDMVDYLEKAK